MLHRRSAFLLSLPLVLLPLACAGSGAGERAPLAAAGSSAKSSSSSTSAALAPEAGRLAQDVRWLADDARQGRRAGTRGEEQAARWLAQRLEALGLEPAGTDGFLQAFEVPLPVRDGGGSSVEVRAGDQRVVAPAEGQKDGLVPLFCSAAGTVEGPLVFAGYGISDADLGRDDYAGLNVSEAVVLIVRGTPPDALLPKAEPAPAAETPANPHGAAQPQTRSWGGAGALFYKVMEAKRRGAKAVIVAQHPTSSEPMLVFGEGGGAEARIPALHASAAVAEALFPGYAGRVARLDAGESAGAAEPSVAKLVADVVRERGTAHNVLGRLRGKSAEETLVIGAHFDHLGHGGSGSLAPGEFGQIHNGADDNASGTAVVLELARVLGGGPRPSQDVVFALWSGEELGLLGSEHWARNPTFPLDSVQANLNLDMVGRADAGKLSVLGAGSARPFEALLEGAGPRAGLTLEVSLSGQGVGGSDHQTFLKRQIPALHFFSGLHADYHRPSDDTERFERDGAAKVAALVLDLVDDLAAAGELVWIPPAKEAAGATPGGFKTRFGSIPDYAFDGTGMRLDGTSPGGPAEKAGLLRGDVIVGVGDQRIDGLGDFMLMLNTHKPGDVLAMKILRDGAEETVQVTLESSQIE
jgi:Zn-dependent M28 family amino/carboxypeptidase